MECCAGQELTLAQKISRGIQKVAKQREQEDAQEFLTFLLDSAHQELLKLRAMYDTQGMAGLSCKQTSSARSYCSWMTSLVETFLAVLNTSCLTSGHRNMHNKQPQDLLVAAVTATQTRPPSKRRNLLRRHCNSSRSLFAEATDAPESSSLYESGSAVLGT